MIDPERPLASWFLLTSATFFLVVFALPLLFAPLRWARWFRWKLPEQLETSHLHLTVYFARCLGAVALSVIVITFRSAGDPRGHRILFDLIALLSGLMVLVHAWGAIRRTQPWTEHVEIVLYAAVAAAAIWIGSSL